MRRTNEDEEEIEVGEAKRGTLVRFFCLLDVLGTHCGPHFCRLFFDVFGSLNVQSGMGSGRPRVLRLILGEAHE